MGAAAFLLTHWPFTPEMLSQALQEASGRQVRIGRFTKTYFPPGCIAEDLRFLRHKNPGGPPIITVKRLTIEASLTGLIGTRKRITRVQVVGMRLTIPPKSTEAPGNNVLLNAGPGGKSLVISEVSADGAELEFLSRDRDKKPYLLHIQKLGIAGIGSGRAMDFRVTLRNTEPPGLIQAGGKFGPWNAKDAGATPASGTYTYDGIELSVFRGIAGEGKARGTFWGTLGSLQTKGSVDVPAFSLDGTSHPVSLQTSYEATVNATNGDVLLHPALARFRQTQIEVRGSIAGHEKEDGKTASFEVAVPQGRVDDLLYLFSRGEPGLSGLLNARGKFLWPPDGRKFLESIHLDLQVGMSQGHFTAPDTQDSINRISKSAGGETKKQENTDLRTVLSRITAAIRMSGGVAHIAQARFDVPGADATVEGTYNVIDQRTDLHGTLDTRGHLSDTTSGFKALVLKAMGPLFKKRDSERMIPFAITGSYGETAVTIDWKRGLLGKKN